MEESSNKFVSKLKHFGLEIFAFLTSKTFIKNFVGILGMFTALFFFTSMWLKCYTDHGEVLHMDTFEGLNLYDAQELAHQNNYTLVVDSISMPKMKPLTITKQHPKPNAPVKENRTVYVTVVKRVKDQKSIPKLTGSREEFNQFKKLLKQVGIRATVLQEKFDRSEPGTILEVLYQGDTITNEIREKPLMFPEGSELEFIISKRSDDNVNVPDIMCKTYREAQFILENRDLNFGSIIKDQTVVDKNKAYIWKQEPQLGSLPFGANVNIWITQNFPDGCDGLLNPVEAPRDDASDNSSGIEEDEDEEFNN